MVDRLLVAPAASQTPRAKDIPDPAKFDGTRTKLRPFVAQLRLKLVGNAERFPNPQLRLAYTTSLLEGPAFDQVHAYITNNGINLQDYENIIDLLDTAFDDPDRVGTAERELRKLR